MPSGPPQETFTCPECGKRQWKVAGRTEWAMNCVTRRRQCLQCGQSITTRELMDDHQTMQHETQGWKYLDENVQRAIRIVVKQLAKAEIAKRFMNK